LFIEKKYDQNNPLSKIHLFRTGPIYNKIIKVQIFLKNPPHLFPLWFP